MTAVHRRVYRLDMGGEGMGLKEVEEGRKGITIGEEEAGGDLRGINSGVKSFLEYVEGLCHTASVAGKRKHTKNSCYELLAKPSAHRYNIKLTTQDALKLALLNIELYNEMLLTL